MTALTNSPAESIAEREGMLLDQFLQRQDEQPFELIEGEIIPVTPSMFGSGEIARLLVKALVIYDIPNDHILAYSDTTFVLPNASDDWVKGSRIPDVMVYQTERLNEYRTITKDWRVKPLLLIPDLAVEVVSPTDRLPKVWRKASIYLEDGVRLVWIINPLSQLVTIFAADEAPITLDKSGVLSGGDVLPGFTLTIRDLFAE